MNGGQEVCRLIGFVVIMQEQLCIAQGRQEGGIQRILFQSRLKALDGLPVATEAEIIKSVIVKQPGSGIATFFGLIIKLYAVKNPAGSF